MNTLIIGATGFIGTALTNAFERRGLVCTTASRSDRPGVPRHRQFDTTDVESLARAMAGHEVVVNCVSGDAQAIAFGARCIVEAAKRTGVRRIVHMSSMAVYAAQQALLTESATLVQKGNWYASAKIQAEDALADFPGPGRDVVVFRIGCVAGPGSDQWVRRLGDLLHAHVLGDLGKEGDGWSNLVAIDDVCQAVIAAASAGSGTDSMRVFNLAAPGSPRWNTYLVDLAVAISATPVVRRSRRRLKAEAMIKSPFLLIFQKLSSRVLGKTIGASLLTPSQLHLFRSAGRLDVEKIQHAFPFKWETYEATLANSAAWYRNQREKGLRP